MELFPFRPNWATPVTERLAWLTDVIEGYDATEERTPLRSLPRRTLEYTLVAHGDNRGLLDALLWRWQAEQYQLPIWTDPQRLAAPLSAGATAIPATTTDYDFVAPGQAVLWRSPTVHEIVEVQGLTATELTLSAPVAADWPAGTQLYPVRFARLLASVPVSRRTAAVAVATARFEIEAGAVTAAPGATLYRGVEVFDRRPNWAQPPGLDYQRKAALLDYDLGTLLVDDLADLPATRSGYATLLRDRADIAGWRGWLAARQGRYAPVWVPSWTLDLTQLATLGAADTDLSVSSLSYEDRYRLDNGQRDIALFHRPSRTWYYRRIESGVAGGPGEDVLTLDAALGVSAAVGELSPICWLTLSRLESDAVEIAWHTSAVAECSLMLRSVRA